MSSRARIVTVCASVVFINIFGLVNAAAVLATTSLPPHEQAFSKGGPANRKTVDDVCSTPECFDAASKFLSHINTDVDPCDDFYEFACGKYADSAVIDDDASWNMPMSESPNYARWRALQMIEKIDVSKAPKPFAEIKTSYENCIKNGTDGRYKMSRDRWLEQVKVLDMPWPVITPGKFNESLLNYTLVFNGLFVFGVMNDARNTSNEILGLGTRPPKIGWGFITKPATHEVLQAFSNFMIDVAVYSGANKTQASAEFQEYLSLERELYDVLFPSKQHRSVFVPYTITTIGELDKKYPNMSLGALSEKKDNSTEVETTLTAEELSKLEKLILSKPKRLLGNWLLWRFVASIADRFDGYVDHRWSLVQATLYGHTSPTAKSIECFDDLSQQSRSLLAVLYHAKYLDQSFMDGIFKLFGELKQQYSQLVQKTQWLTDITKASALKKIDNIIGTFDVCREFVLDDKSAASQNNFILSDDPSANNRVNVKKIMDIISSNKTLSSAAKYSTMKCEEFFYKVAEYNLMSNVINLGPGPWTEYYDIRRPKYVNYASLGFTIGHELGHSLDVLGRHVDENGTLTSQWDSASNASYVERAQCFREQYDAYRLVDSGAQLNGVATGPDDIADNIGIKLAYYAYDAWSSKNEPEKQLPGLLDYSPRQLFWISSAHGFCTKYRPKVEENLIELDVHSASSYRINGAVSNRPEFSRDFGCSSTAKMNRPNKCTLW